MGDAGYFKDPLSAHGITDALRDAEPLADIVGAAICLDLLGRPRVLASAVELGAGFADCAHGRLSVPAPATLELLGDVPTRRGGLPTSMADSALPACGW